MNLCSFHYKGRNFGFNSELLDNQDAWENIPKILELRLKLYDLSHMCEELIGHSKAGLKEVLQEIEVTEYHLQDAWNFPRDSAYHTYQWKLKGCICGCSYNLDEARQGSSFRYIDENCPYHGIDII